ncbi:MAG: efflux RND transporter periplasmic adaptor subunit [Bacteroidaceae bacterium]|nr:efflux RND transporter periplasmic adaptor subunit [Bacteroidaceae bacterium]
MIHKKVLYLLLLILTSCGGAGDTSRLTCRVEKRDFREEVVADGTAQSVSTLTISCGVGIDGTVKYLIPDGSYVNAGDTLCVIESHDLENNLDQLRTTLEAIEAERTKAAATYHLEHALQTARMETGLAEASIASLDSLQLQFSPPLQRRIKELQLRRAAIEQERAQKNLQAMEITWQIDSQRIETYYAYVLRRIADQHQSIEGLTLRAPQPGLAIIAESWSEDRPLQVGDNVWDRMPLVVLPDVSNMEVVMMIPESDYKRIDLEDEVDITFSSDPDNQAWGRITKKMPIGTEASQGSRVKLFEVTATIDSTLYPIRPQGSARCRICLHLLEDTLVVPSVCVMDADSTKVAYVHRGGHIVQQEVEVAYASPSETVVARGLKEGEELLLLRPTSGAIRKKSFLN